MRTKKKTVEQKKNRNSQKSVKSVRFMGVGICGVKDFWYVDCCHVLSVSSTLWIYHSDVYVVH